MPAAHEPCRALWRPASENLQGRKPRGMRVWRCRTLDLWGVEGRAGWGEMGRRGSAETLDTAETRNRCIAERIGSVAGRRLGSPLGTNVTVGRSTTLADRGPAMEVTGLGACGLRERSHEVSIRIVTIGSVGWDRGEPPRAKISMMIMRPPQHGQG